jgi:hypothetical protein
MIVDLETVHVDVQRAVAYTREYSNPQSKMESDCDTVSSSQELSTVRGRILRQLEASLGTTDVAQE